jgi:hypothetical protein
MPAPKGNANAAQHGLSALKATGRVPLKMPGGKFLRTQLRRMRRELTAEIISIHGSEPTLYQHHVILSATRHEARARLLERWLAETPTMKGPMRLAVFKAIGEASNDVDRALRLLGIDSRTRTVSVWEAHMNAANDVDAGEPDDGTEPDATPDATPASQDGT